MVWALILIVVIGMTAVILVTFLTANASEAGGFVNRNANYYVSLAGLEYGYGALLSPYGPPGKTLLDDFVAKPDTEVMDDDFALYEGAKVVGTAHVVISKHVEQFIDSFGVNVRRVWVIIASTGSREGRTGSSTNYMRINADNPVEVHRDGARLPFSLP